MELKKFARAKLAGISDMAEVKALRGKYDINKSSYKDIKKSIPWAIARGITGAGAGAIFGLPTARAMGLKGRSLLKFLAGTAGTGLGVSFAKGLSEKSIEKAVAKAMKGGKKSKK